MEKDKDLVQAEVAGIIENVFGLSLDHFIVAPLFPQKCAVVTGLSMRL